MKHPRWQIPEMWPGETVVIIGGGPSLTREQVEACRGRCRAIAVNTSYKIAPWADVLYGCDAHWWQWHRDECDFKAFAGLKVALSNARTWQFDPTIKVVENYGDHPGLCELPDGLYTGRNSGNQAIQLAAKLGARRITLLAFDMKAQGKRTHWHWAEAYGHRRPTDSGEFAEHMLPRFPALKAALDAKGIQVINCTPGSALTIFPMMSIEAALGAIAA